MPLPQGSFTFTTLPDNVKIGKYSSIAAQCYFHDTSKEHLYTTNKKVVFTTNWAQPNVPMPIFIGNDVWIGEGVRVLPGVTIGDGVVIGAGAVIAKDIPAYAVVVGNPQVIKKYRFSPEIIDKLIKIKWWDWNDATINTRRPDMMDIDIFLSKYGGD